MENRNKAAQEPPESQSAGEEKEKQHVFSELTADDHQPTEIESLCTNCGENGMTRLLLTKIPHYKEVILMSFSCEHCGNTNNEIQSGERIEETGIRLKVKIEKIGDLSRQVVKSDFASFTIPEIELEIPSNTQKGAITTIEGLLQRTIAGLNQDQTVRRALDPENAEKIDKYVQRIEDLLLVNAPFHVIVKDISGNSFIENLNAPKVDPNLEITHFHRTKEEDHALGIYTQEELNGETEEETKQKEEKSKKKKKPESKDNDDDDDDENALTAEKLKDEVLTFPTNCPDCNAPSQTKMKVTNIPHFKDVVIMATVCEYCGHKTNEVKSGGGIEPKGTRIILRVTDPSDLNRDVLKSETCSITIPELEFEAGGYSLGGRFTTLEGLLTHIKEQLETNPLFGCSGGDSKTQSTDEKVRKFKEEMKELIDGKRNFTIILDDPAGNSYLQNVYAPEEDPELKIVKYERSFEQNEGLGLNDMKVEGYEDDRLMGKDDDDDDDDEKNEDVEASRKLLPVPPERVKKTSFGGVDALVISEDDEGEDQS